MTKCYMGCYISNRYLHSKDDIWSFLRLLAVFFAPYAYASSGLDMKINFSSNIVLKYYINTIPIRYITRLIPIAFLDIAQITHGEQGLTLVSPRILCGLNCDKILWLDTKGQ